MSAILKFKHVLPGQVFQHADKTKTDFSYEAFMKLPDKKKMIGHCCACNDDNWNAANINADGVFTVHFCLDTEVVITPGRNAFSELKTLMGDD